MKNNFPTEEKAIAIIKKECHKSGKFFKFYVQFYLTEDGMYNGLQPEETQFFVSQSYLFVELICKAYCIQKNLGAYKLEGGVPCDKNGNEIVVEKTCIHCQEKFDGRFKFCPHCGTAAHEVVKVR